MADGALIQKRQLPAGGTSSVKYSTALVPSKREDLGTSLFDAAECMDFMTCACILFPENALVEEEIDLPINRTGTSTEGTSDDCSNPKVHNLTIEVNEKENISELSQNREKDSIASDSPIAFVAASPRQYGMCPLGQAETIYFTTNEAIF